MRGREQKWPGTVVKEIDQITGAADVPAERADGFRQCSDLDVNAAMQFEVIDGAATVTSEYTGSVSVIHHHDGAILLGEIAQCG